MKRYLLFVGQRYYAKGGMEDFLGDFDELETAKAYINPAVEYLDDLDGWWDDMLLPVPLKDRPAVPFEKINGDTWAHIYDTEKQEITFRTYEV